MCRSQIRAPRKNLSIFFFRTTSNHDFLSAGSFSGELAQRQSLPLPAQDFMPQKNLPASTTVSSGCDPFLPVFLQQVLIASSSHRKMSIGLSGTPNERCRSPMVNKRMFTPFRTGAVPAAQTAAFQSCRYCPQNDGAWFLTLPETAECPDQKMPHLQQLDHIIFIVAICRLLAQCIQYAGAES